MEKFLKIVFILIGAIIIIGLVILLLPLLIIGILLGLFFGKLKIAQLNSLRNRNYGFPDENNSDDANDVHTSPGQSIDYEDGEVIDVQAKEIDEKQ